MQVLSAKVFFSETIAPTILGAFLRRSEFTKDKKYIFTYFSFKESKYFNVDKQELEYYHQQYCNSLNSHSGKYPYWHLNNGEYDIPLKYNGVFILHNDMNLTNNDEKNVDNFINLLVLKIYKEDWLTNTIFVKERNDFLRGFFDTACSFDGSNLLACDYYCKTKQDIRKLGPLVENNIFPLEYANFNARRTKETAKKADQFRINVKYYLNEIGTYSEYKALIISNGHKDFYNKKIIKKENIFYFNVPFKEKSKINQRKAIQKFHASYQNFLSIAYNYRIENKITEEDFEFYRQFYGLLENPDENAKEKRNQRIKNSVLNEEPDFCLCCGNKYDIKDRSFLQYRKIGNEIYKRYYFEIHHAISLANGINENEIILDTIDNLGKLCPVCHRCLTGKSGLEEDIYELLNNMLNNSEKIRNFVEMYFNTTDRQTILEKMYMLLK